MNATWVWRCEIEVHSFMHSFRLGFWGPRFVAISFEIERGCCEIFWYFDNYLFPKGKERTWKDKKSMSGNLLIGWFCGVNSNGANGYQCLIHKSQMPNAKSGNAKNTKRTKMPILAFTGTYYNTYYTSRVLVSRYCVLYFLFFIKYFFLFILKFLSITHD